MHEYGARLVVPKVHPELGVNTLDIASATVERWAEEIGATAIDTRRRLEQNFFRYKGKFSTGGENSGKDVYGADIHGVAADLDDHQCDRALCFPYEERVPSGEWELRMGQAGLFYRMPDWEGEKREELVRSLSKQLEGHFRDATEVVMERFGYVRCEPEEEIMPDGTVSTYVFDRLFRSEGETRRSVAVTLADDLKHAIVWIHGSEPTPYTLPEEGGGSSVG